MAERAATAPTSDRVWLWCHECKEFVEHQAAYVDTSRRPHVLHVTPAQIAEHRATHPREDQP